MAQVNYGLDYAATTGLDVTFRYVEGSELMGQVALRRLLCGKGQLIGCPDEDLVDVRDMVGVGMTPAQVARNEALCQAAVEGDQRIQSATVSLTPMEDGSLIVRAAGYGALGPFSLLLSVTQVSVSVLAGEA